MFVRQGSAQAAKRSEAASNGLPQANIQARAILERQLFLSAGRVTERLDAYTATAARAHYSYETSLTPYTRYGDWFAWSCLALGLALVIVSQIPSYRS